MTQINGNGNRWRLNRQVSLGVIVQVLMLASLIIGSWVNLQSQLNLLQHDMRRLIDCQNDLHKRIETLHTHSITTEYRLSALEKTKK